MEQRIFGCPYKGLIPYTESDAAFFFGREKDTRLIIANLFATRLTLLYGVSGVGKSSVLRAGIIHKLQSRDDLLVIIFNDWQSNPIAGIKAAVAKIVKNKIGLDTSALKSTTLADYLNKSSEKTKRQIILIFDQFEEYFLYHPQYDKEGGFEIEFPVLLNHPELAVSCLISLREDSLANLDRFEGSIPNLFDNYYRLEHLDRNAANDAISKPIEQYNRQYVETGKEIEIDQELINAVIEQVKTGQVYIGIGGRGKIPTSQLEDIRVETPYLQLVMRRLWEEERREGSRRLRPGTFERLGGAEKIIRKHLDDSLNILTENDQEIAANIFRYLVTPSGTKISYSMLDLAEIARIGPTQIPKLPQLLDKLSSPGFRILRPLEPPQLTREEDAALREAFRKTYRVLADYEDFATKRFEIFHDVLGPAILDWRARHLQAQERVKGEEKAAQQRRRAKHLILIAAAIFLFVGILLGVLSYRYNWWGARTTYLAAKSADKMDVIDWLVKQKFREYIVADDISHPDSKRALTALRLAYELDPENKKIKEYLDEFLRDIKMVVRMKSASLELLQQNMKTLQQINKEVPYKPIASEIDSLNTRVTWMINLNTANALLNNLQLQEQDSTVSDTSLLNRYEYLLNNYSLYADSMVIKQQITSFQKSIKKYNQQLVIQDSETITILQKLNSWKLFIETRKRNSPEKSYARKQIQHLDSLMNTYASIRTEENFVTCHEVVELMPRGISDSFAPGRVWAWARINAPRNENVTFRWYKTDVLFGTHSVPIKKSPGYRVYVAKNYITEVEGLNEVRLYNSQNILIGRRVFQVH